MSIVLAAAVIYLILRNNSIRMKSELAGYFHEVKNLKNELERVANNTSLKNRNAISEMMSINENMLRTTDMLMDAYYRHQGRPEVLSSKVKKILDENISAGENFRKIEKLTELTYPGLLDDIYARTPKLNDNEKYIITLLCCGFSTSTICVLTGLDESNLNVRKTRLARKLGVNISLSKFIAQQLEAHNIMQ